MSRNIVNRAIQALGRTGYVVDENVTDSDLAILVCEKMIQLLRGLLLRFYLRQSQGLVFVGNNCKIKHRDKILFGKSVFIGDNVEMNALSKGGISTGQHIQS